VDWTATTADIIQFAADALTVNNDIKTENSLSLQSDILKTVADPLPSYQPPEAATPTQASAVQAVVVDVGLFESACYRIQTDVNEDNTSTAGQDIQAYAAAWNGLQSSIPNYYNAIGDTQDALNFAYATPP
jgi:hypothetical protein